jgi:hypothetical protein
MNLFFRDFFQLFFLLIYESIFCLNLLHFFIWHASAMKMIKDCLSSSLSLFLNDLTIQFCLAQLISNIKSYFSSFCCNSAIFFHLPDPHLSPPILTDEAIILFLIYFPYPTLMTKMITLNHKNLPQKYFLSNAVMLIHLSSFLLD